jgi:hypothetical protein
MNFSRSMPVLRLTLSATARRGLQVRGPAGGLSALQYYAQRGEDLIDLGRLHDQRR